MKLITPKRPSKISNLSSLFSRYISTSPLNTKNILSSKSPSLNSYSPGPSVTSFILRANFSKHNLLKC